MGEAHKTTSACLLLQNWEAQIFKDERRDRCKGMRDEMSPCNNFQSLQVPERKEDGQFARGLTVLQQLAIKYSQQSQDSLGKVGWVGAEETQAASSMREGSLDDLVKV